MHYLILALQVAVALVLLNVWLVRANQPTPYRGGGAQNMKQEFQTYGLPTGAMYVVGGLKVLAAICFIVGIWVPMLVLPAAVVVGVLMVGALAMHLKVKDSALKSAPALCLLVACAVIGFGALRG